jgi:hypothetical protein
MARRVRRFDLAAVGRSAGAATLSVSSADPDEEDSESLTLAASSAHFLVLGGVD